MVAKDAAEYCYQGSCVLDPWELRISRRCLTDDLGFAADSPFADLLGHEIIKAFVKDRRAQSHGTRQISPLTCNREVWRLGYGDNHRGATWYDDRHRTIWLLAYHGQHRSGADDDAFPYFKELDRLGLLLPDESDYEALRGDRDRRFVEMVVRQVPVLLTAARSAPEEEQAASLGGSADVGVAIEVVETLEELHLRISPLNLHPPWLEILLGAVFADRPWEVTDQFPGREPSVDELRFRGMSDRASA